MMINNPNLDSMNVNVYKKFNSILSFHSQDKGRKRNSDIKKMKLFNPNIDLINDNVHTKFG